MDVLRAANVYHTDHALLFIVVIITLLVMMLVSATLYASCVLGRAVSMNSLEIAKTFNAPLLAIEDSNNDNKGLVRSLDTKPFGIVLSRSLRSMYQWLV
ncbi:hypothetical protein IG631_20254 [Alternaria alternata]|nr:hypothetical protein IG631_20254 [Alternaria alternata]